MKKIDNPGFYDLIIYKKDTIKINGINQNVFIHIQHSFIFKKLYINVINENNISYKRKLHKNERLIISNSSIILSYYGQSPVYFTLWIIQNNICSINSIHVPRSRNSIIKFKNHEIESSYCWFIESFKNSLVTFNISNSSKNVDVKIYNNFNNFQQLSNNMNYYASSKLFIIMINKSQNLIDLTIKIDSKSLVCEWNNNDDFFKYCDINGSCNSISELPIHITSYRATSWLVLTVLFIPITMLFIFQIYYLFK